MEGGKEEGRMSEYRKKKWMGRNGKIDLNGKRNGKAKGKRMRWEEGVRRVRMEGIRKTGKKGGMEEMAD